ncbi:uncharacterized protein LOC132265440 [Phlebotomus argentipes]|uniref:uncharacterized protein LOC132265440 n=1 Tax=Phlebotomus argentipes TaxID=94469 RepID=UPI0028933AF1|nr:uncharacterized protein LOC132265440 [Phlebotomus argentipes]XP_059622115.1 uncharacterized protein LOC132265440 [Phlebotomus argentipes]XP_059622116.1 uncharacterized protein LOC132265440 [Phlebotomus argentipes]
MPRSKIILENVPKDDKSFLLQLPPDGYRRWDRLRRDHPTPLVFVEYETADDCKNAIEVINNDCSLTFRAKMCVEKSEKQNRRSDSQKISVSSSRQSVAKMPLCVLCEKPATFMCERCLDPYCSAICQDVHWSSHRAICRRKPRLVPFENSDEIIAEGLPEFTTPSNDSMSDKNAYESFAKPTKKVLTNGVPKTPTLLNGNERNQSQDVPKEDVPKQHSAMPEVPETLPQPALAAASPEQPVKTMRKILADIPRVEFPPSGTTIAVVYVPEKENNNAMFIRAQETRDTMKKILDTAKTYAEKLPDLQKPPVYGQLYLAPFLTEPNDDNWYRVLAKTFKPDTMTVIVAYIDFGNTDEVPMTSLKEMPNEMIQLPRVSFRVVLNGITSFEDSDKARRYRTELTQRLLVMKYEGEPDMMATQVNLYEVDSDMCINKFFNTQEELEKVRHMPELKFTIDSVPLKIFTVIENVEFIIQYDDLLKDGYLHFVLKREYQKIADITTLAEQIGEKSPPYTPSMKELCIAKYAYGDDADEVWYRVVIHEKIEQEDCFLAYFIDFGNYGKVAAKNVREMEQKLVLLECPLIYAFIEGFDTPWPEERIAKFHEISEKTHAILKAEKIENKGSKGYFVSLLADVVTQLK